MSLWLPVLLVPALCLGPLIFVLPPAFLVLLIAGFISPHPFVRWHTGQCMVVTAPAALFVFGGLAVYFLSDHSSSDFSGTVCFTLIVALGWYFANWLGLRQANRGRCWLWQWLAVSPPLPRPWAVPAAPVAAPLVVSVTAAPPLPVGPHAAFDRGLALTRANNRAGAVASFLFTFRSGSPELRRRAVAELEKLGEVETF